MTRLFPLNKVRGFAAGVLGAMALCSSVRGDAADLGTGSVQAAQSVIRNQIPALIELKPAQKTILEFEVLPQAQAFLRSWSATGGEVDRELLKSFLQFRCESISRREGDSSRSPCDAWVLVRAEKGCEKCESAQAPIRAGIEKRLLRRGFSAVSMTPEALGISPSLAALTGQDRAWSRERELERNLLENASRNGMGAVISISIRKLPPDSPDDPHADEEHFGVHALVAVRAGTQDGRPYSSYSEQLEFQGRESADALAERLLTEGISRVASSLQREEQNRASSGETVIHLELAGIRSFQHAARVGMVLENAIREIPGARLRERNFRHGAIGYEVRGLSGSELLVARLGTLIVGDESLGEAPKFRIETLEDGRRVVATLQAVGRAGSRR